jgi:glucokinase
MIQLCRERVRGLAKEKYVIGADLGGTWTRVALSDERGNFVEKMNEEVDRSSASAISKQIIRLARSLCKKHGVNVKNLRGVGIASAGPINQEKGVLLEPPNLQFNRIPLTKPISEQLGIPAYLIGDCAGAVLAEHIFGAGKGLANHVYITISTGIGGGAIVNDTLLLGKDGNGHEIGHFVIDYKGQLTCGCGRRGHWEAYCSGRNLPNYVRMRFEEVPEKTVKESLLFKRAGGDLSKLNAADLFAAAKNGDTLSLQLVEEIGVLNAMGFANAINAYDPSLITVGGTVTLKNKKMILSPIKKQVKDYAINRVPKIMVTPLGDDACIYGAVAAALRYIP